MTVLPPLRLVEPVPVTVKGERMICLTDPHGYVEDQMLLSPPAFFVAACLDGAHDVAAIQQEFSKAFNGIEPPEQEILSVVNSLDEAGFLRTEAFVRLQERVENAFRARHTRPATLTGQAYPEAPEQLREWLARFFVDDAGDDALQRITPRDGRPLRGLVAPHIDFERGGNVYGAAYQHLYASGKPDLVILFGVAHFGAETPLVLTRKDFETPLGTLRTDHDVVAQLEKVCPWDPYAAEMAHRMEHSLEFQAVMLAYLYGTDLPIVPILCAFPGADGEEGDAEKEAIDVFLDAFGAIVRDEGRNSTVIAAADLAHVGRRFGDDLDISEAIVADVRQRDMDALEHVKAVAPEKFYDAIMEDNNARHVCGLGSIYATLKTLEGTVASGEMIKYDYAPDPMGGIVSFAALALE